MSRAQRLLDLIQLLRGYRRPVSGAVLAEALGISLRTLYRDIETLNAQGRRSMASRASATCCVRDSCCRR